MENGVSRMYRLKDMIGFIEKYGLRLVNTINNIGMVHTMLEVKL